MTAGYDVSAVDQPADLDRAVEPSCRYVADRVHNLRHAAVADRVGVLLPTRWPGHRQG